MKLTDNEKRDIVKLIEEGKNLPEKYRFLLFDSSNKVEVNWEGKNPDITNVVLPFQIIEQVDEPRTEKVKAAQHSFEFALGRQTTGWSNKLIWGDNKFIVSSLVYGPMKDSIEKEGGIKLIYIDPPFSVGQNYTIPIDIGDNDKYDKKPSIIENFAYRNTWNREGNSFLQMIYERVSLMKELLRNDGVLVLRIDYHWGHYVKAILDEILGQTNFRNEIFINRTKKNVKKNFKQHNLITSIESLFVYSKSEDFNYLDTSYNLNKTREGYWRATDDSAGKRNHPERKIEGKTFLPRSGCHFKFSQENMDNMYVNNKLRIHPNNPKALQYWVEPTQTGLIDTDWTDIPGYSFSTKYPTENSEILLERVIKACTNENDLVCDFFNGSGTTATVCEKLSRKWVVSDIGKFSIHVTKKRLIETQRLQKNNKKNWRAFEILNIGKYQKQHYLNDGLFERDEIKYKTKINRDRDFENLILEAYNGLRVDGFKALHGRKNDVFISIGPVNHNVSRNQIEEIIIECLENKITKVDVLGFEYEMGLFPSIQEEAKLKGLRLNYKQIPNDIFNEKAVKTGKVKFYDVSYIEIKPHIKKNKLAVELTDFVTFYNDETYEDGDKLRKSSSKIIIENGKMIEKTINKEGIVSENILTKLWTDWIDYWSVDFDFESKPEIIKFKKEDGKIDEIWTGNYIFENEWQSFRSKSTQKLDLISSQREILKSKTKVAVKIVDIFGNDTMKIIEVKF
ncbi:site-specific DNA-methyltransferase [Pelagibacteraceae bacterium]|nr:site-specific DNA-methyltransferase [Pelagibacteraceae bacterium]